MHTKASHAEVRTTLAFFPCFCKWAPFLKVVIVAQPFSILHILVEAHQLCRHLPFALAGFAFALAFAT